MAYNNNGGDKMMKLRDKKIISRIILALCFAFFNLVISGCTGINDGESPVNSILNSLGLGKNQQPAESNPDNSSEPGTISITPAPITGTEAPLDASLTETPIPTPTTYNISLWVPPAFDINQDTKAGKALAGIIKDYIEEHPNVNVNVRVKAVSGDSSMVNTLTTANHIAQDVLPSLALLSRNDMETAVQRGLAQPITTDIFTDSNTWYSYARQSAVIDSTIYGIPVLGDGQALVYRPSKTGTDLGDWQDILSRGLPIGFAPSSSMFPLFVYISMGGKLVNEQGQPYLDQQKLYDTLNFFNSGGQNGAFPPSLTQLVDQNQVWQRFNDGTISIIIPQFSTFRHYQASDMTVHKLPLSDGMMDYPLINTWNLVLVEDNLTLQPEIIRFAEYFCDIKVNDLFSAEAGFLPVRNSEHEAWIGDPQYDISQSMSEYGLLIPNNQITSKIVPIINNAVTQVIKNQMIPEDAAKEAMTSFN